VVKEQKVMSSVIIEIAVLSPLRELIDVPEMDVSSTDGHKWDDG
jgi:hypothetical protein